MRMVGNGVKEWRTTLHTDNTHTSKLEKAHKRTQTTCQQTNKAEQTDDDDDEDENDAIQTHGGVSCHHRNVPNCTCSFDAMRIA